MIYLNSDPEEQEKIKIKLPLRMKNNGKCTVLNGL